MWLGSDGALPDRDQPTPYTGAALHADVRGARVSSPGLARRRVGG
jgi:hypothetical protein